MEVSCVVTSVRYVSQSCLHTHTLGHSPTQRDTVRETETGWSRGGEEGGERKYLGKLGMLWNSCSSFIGWFFAGRAHCWEYKLRHIRLLPLYTKLDLGIYTVRSTVLFLFIYFKSTYIDMSMWQKRILDWIFNIVVTAVVPQSLCKNTSVWVGLMWFPDHHKCT